MSLPGYRNEIKLDNGLFVLGPDVEGFERIGEEVSEIIERRPASMVVARVVRPKFVPRDRDREALTKILVAEMLEKYDTIEDVEETLSDGPTQVVSSGLKPEHLAVFYCAFKAYRGKRISLR